MTARQPWGLLVALLLVLLFTASLVVFGQEGEPDPTPIEVSIDAPDGTEIWCLDFGEWGTCDLVGYRW
ncbi:MAG: hypothetical protein AB7V15_05600 [Acidimicrobiia bacterium]